MKALIISHYHGDGTPTANYVTPQIIEFKKLGVEVKVIVPMPFFKRDYLGHRVSRIISITNIDGIEYVFVRFLSLSNFGLLHFNSKSLQFVCKLFSKKILANFKPDIIHCHTIGLDSELGFLYKKKYHCPEIVTVHGTDVMRMLRPNRKKRLRLYCDRVDAIIAVSDVLKARIQPYAQHTSCYTILNGFSLDGDIDANKKSIKQPYRFLQVSNLIPLKKVDVTINAFATIAKKHPEATLHIVGDGIERSKLESLTRDLGMEDKISFLGYRPHYEVLNEMREAMYFIMVSAPEGFGIVYLEAMSLGCITIGTKGEGISSFIVNGKNGFLVPVNDIDAIISIFENIENDKETFDRITNEAKKDCEALSWSNNARKYAKLYEIYTGLTLFKR